MWYYRALRRVRDNAQNHDLMLTNRLAYAVDKFQHMHIVHNLANILRLTNPEIVNHR
jgi:hypothetical protein